MLDLQLRSEARGADSVVAGYACPCGCKPLVTYRRGDAIAADGCCCGNQFAVGPEAATHVTAPEGYEMRSGSLSTPWGERLPAIWAIGPSTHGEAREETHHNGHAQDAGAEGAVDPVCGMTVDRDGARAKGLHSQYAGTDYFFCGKGCKLEFDEDPGRFLDPSYEPSM